MPIGAAPPIAEPGTRKGNVFYKEFTPPPKPATIPGAIDIDDLVAEIEGGSTKAAQAIARGRKWVAKEFYSGVPTMAGLRLGKGWSQTELAKRVSTSQSYIARVELGHVDPQLSTVVKLAAALDVSVEAVANAIANGARE